MLSRFSSAAPTHLLPAMAALLVAAALLTGLGMRADARLQRFGPALASLDLPEATRGAVLQRRIFALPDCLPIYGSSELASDQPTRADRFFHRKQRGFDAFVFGQPGDRCPEVLLELASLGDVVRGRKVAVFLSPVWFLPLPKSRPREHSGPQRFAALFSPLQAGRFAVYSPLGPALKHRIAARLLDRRKVIQDQSPLLTTVLESLAGTSWPRRCCFIALRPLMEMQNQVWTWQERLHWLELTRDRGVLRHAGGCYRSRRKHPDWTQLERDVAHTESKRAHPTFYSCGSALDAPSPEFQHEHLAPAELDADADFLRRMDASPGWNDLELLLSVARELHIHLLLIGQPINGLYSDAQGITPRARREYYRRLSRTARAHGVLLRDFSAFEEDRTFFTDLMHPSAEAWIHYDEVLAQFFRPGSI